MSHQALDELKQQIPLLDYLQAHDWQPARQLGRGRLMGLCPLHSDHKPSFLVDPSKSLFYCYGCGRGGDPRQLGVFRTMGSGSLNWMNTDCLGDYRCLARVWLVGALLPCFAPAQPISVGVTGGVPVSPHSQNYGQGCFDRGPLICGPNDFFVKPYAIGPVVDVNLPRGISAEVGFLYERFHIDLAEGLTAPHGGAVNFGQKYSVSADGWLFPFLLKYTFGWRRVAPFADAGATLRTSRPIRWQRHPIGLLSPASTDFGSHRKRSRPGCRNYGGRRAEMADFGHRYHLRDPIPTLDVPILSAGSKSGDADVWCHLPCEEIIRRGRLARRQKRHRFSVVVGDSQLTQAWVILRAHSGN